MVSFILKNWKVSLIVLLFSLLAGAATIANIYINKFKVEKADKEAVIALTGEQQKIMKAYKNKEGKLVTRVNTLDFQNKTIKSLMEEGQLGWLKEFEGLKKSLKNLEYAYKLQAIASDSMKVKLDNFSSFYISPEGDTIVFQGMKFKHTDKYTEIKAVQISLDSVNVTYHVNVPISGTLYWNRKWFLGKKYYEAELVSDNPKVSIPEVISLTAGKKKNK